MSSNEIKLSEDLNIITAEINSYKQVAGQAIFEIGKRLKHVKENDLVHGEFGKWLERIEMSHRQANRFMKVYEEIPSNSSSLSTLGVRALYEIATLPQEERDKEHVTSKGKIKTVDKMTVKELQEVKRKLNDDKKTNQQTIVSQESLYIIKHKGFDGYYKIGKTEDVEARVNTLETASPLGVEIIYSAESNSINQVEKIVHNRYLSRQSNREWFNFSEEEVSEVITYINQLISNI